MSCFIQVFGRLRPSSTKCAEQALSELDQNRIRCEGTPGREAKIFELHRIMGQDSMQEDVFKCVAKKIVEECAEGINGTIFAYGQTGSGKTHTMLGPGNCWSDPDSKGIIPRSVEHLFKSLLRKSDECQRFQFSVKVQFVELYNESIYDLLANSEKPICLRDTGSDIILDGAEYETVDNYLDLMHVVKRGWDTRRTAETSMNRDSSRSHALLIIKIQTQEHTGNLLTTRYSTLNLVDLAGSERQIHTKATGDRLKEATHINGSLTVLGRCIRELSKLNHTFIPYRDSILTHILKNSLGGNSRTAVIVNMHPDKQYLAESISTLQFATACSRIKNQVLRNETMSGQQENSYKEAIKQLRHQLDEAERNAREEYNKTLEEIEKWRNNAFELKGELNEMRTKYKMALVRSDKEEELILPSEIAEKLVISQNITNMEFIEDEYKQKLELAKFEIEAKNNECEVLRKELAEAQSRVTEHLNESIAYFPTPRTNRRRTRNPRRETLYAPSPDRSAFNRLGTSDSVQDEEELRMMLQQALIEKEQFRLDLGMTDAKLCKVMDQLVSKENELSKVKKESDIRECALIEQLKDAVVENEDLRGKILAAREQIDLMLVNLSNNEQLIREASEKQKATEKQLNKQLNEMETHYKHVIENMTREHSAQLEKAKQIHDEGVKIELEAANRKINELMESMLVQDKNIEDLTVKMELTRIKYEESVGNENHLKNTLEQTKKDRQELFEKQHAGIESLKKKLRAETSDVKRSLDIERRAHDETRRRLDDIVASQNKEFSDKMDRLRKQFQIEKEAELRDLEMEVRNEMELKLRRQQGKHEEEISTLKSHAESYKKLHEADNRAIKDSLGHSNRHQKISYLESLRNKMADAEAEKCKLREENRVLRKQVEAARSTARVLTSRNT